MPNQDSIPHQPSKPTETVGAPAIPSQSQLTTYVDQPRIEKARTGFLDSPVASTLGGVVTAIIGISLGNEHPILRNILVIAAPIIAGGINEFATFVRKTLNEYLAKRQMQKLYNSTIKQLDEARGRYGPRHAHVKFIEDQLMLMDKFKIERNFSDFKVIADSINKK